MTDFDVVIIGAGAGGLAAAWRLVTSGARVLVLESGRRFEPPKDYPQSEPHFELRSFPYDPKQDAGGRKRYSFGDEQLIDSSWNSYRSFWGSREGNPPNRRVYVQYSHARGVGGSTLHFQGEAHRYHPDSLRFRSRFGIGVDWPIQYDELERYYDIVERKIGVAAPVNPLRPRRTEPLLPPHRLSYASQKLVPSFAACGAKLIPNSLAVLSQPFDGRPACNYCNSCTSGCPIGDKGSADVVFLPEAARTGRLEVRAQHHVLRLEMRGGRVTGVIILDDSDTQRRIKTKFVIMAAGAIETPRLLLAADDVDHPDGIANSHGQVGRNLTETLYWTTTALHPERLSSFRGVPIDGSAWEFAVPGVHKDYVGGFRLMTAHGAAGLRGPVAYARLTAGFGVAHQRRMVDVFGRGIAVAAVGEWLPNDKTFVDLHDSIVDRYGVPLARISSALGENERAMIRKMADTVRRVIAGSGADIVAEVSSLDMFNATHVLGTCRMGSSPKTSVANAQGFAHDVPNLAFADGSLVPSSGSGDSPFLTISALAVRTADNVLAKAKGV
jgi:choline dehydrogenase-like flavoprotein